MDTSKARVRFDEKLKLPGKNDEGRWELERIVNRAAKWQEVSQLDTTALIRIVEEGLSDKKLIDHVMKCGRIEKTNAVYLSKPREKEW